jgi:hypothetical protein
MPEVPQGRGRVPLGLPYHCHDHAMTGPPPAEGWGRTTTGKVITDAMVEEWAAEAERGYDVEQLLAQQRSDQDPCRMVGDAIVLERALRVLQRRYLRVILTEPTAHAVVTWLRFVAADLRREGEHASQANQDATAAGGPHPPAAGLSQRGAGQESESRA